MRKSLIDPKYIENGLFWVFLAQYELEKVSYVGRHLLFVYVTTVTRWLYCSVYGVTVVVAALFVVLREFVNYK